MQSILKMENANCESLVLDVVPSPCSLLGIVTFLQVSLSSAVSQVKQNNFPFQTLLNLHNKETLHISALFREGTDTQSSSGDVQQLQSSPQIKRNWIFKNENHLEKKDFKEKQPMHPSSSSKA